MTWTAELASTYHIDVDYHKFGFRIRDSGPDPFTAGDVTKWLSLPWQSDFYMCRNHWWPSARPDQIVTDEVRAP